MANNPRLSPSMQFSLSKITTLHYKPTKKHNNITNVLMQQPNFCLNSQLQKEKEGIPYHTTFICRVEENDFFNSYQGFGQWLSEA